MQTGETETGALGAPFPSHHCAENHGSAGFFSAS